jgi:hypothetical protein
MVFRPIEKPKNKGKYDKPNNIDGIGRVLSVIEDRRECSSATWKQEWV